MICKRCFRLSDDDEQYCPYCGKSFTDDSEIDVTKKADEDVKKAGSSKTAPENEPIDIFGSRNHIGYTAPPPFSASHYEEIKESPSPWRNFFSSVGHAILYLILFLLIQSLVSTVFATSVMFDAAADYLTDFYENSTEDFATMTDEEYEALILQLEAELMSVAYEVAETIDINLLNAVSSAVTVLALLIIAKIKRRSFAEHTNFSFAPLKRPRAWLVIPAAVAMHFVVMFLLNIIPFSEEMLESYNELYSFIGDSPLYIELLSVVVGAPLVEELIFRGCIHSRLRRIMNPLTAALISSFIFGIVHGHIISATYAFTLGLVLAYLYEKYDSVVIPILFHAGFNASNYIPLLNENSTSIEIIVVFVVAFAILSVCAVVIATDKTKNKDTNNNSKEGL